MPASLDAKTMRGALAALLIGALAGAAAAQPASAPRPLPGFVPKTMDYLDNAVQSDRFEIIEGDLARRYSGDPAIRALGQKLIRDHARASQVVLAAAARSGLAPSGMALGEGEANQIAELSVKTGPEFDHTFVKQQTGGHEVDLQMQETYAAAGADPNLRAAARQITPVVQSHLAMLQQMGPKP